jgi:hypothetical protein
MSDPYDSAPPAPERLRGSGEQVHEYVVERVRGLDLGGPIVFATGGGADTGWRQVFPVTYDIPAPSPDAVNAAEGDGS